MTGPGKLDQAIRDSLVSSPQQTYSTEHITSLHGDPIWEAIWSTIKGWDISRTGAGSYHAPTGDDATAIYHAVKTAIRLQFGLDK